MIKKKVTVKQNYCWISWRSFRPKCLFGQNPNVYHRYALMNHSTSTKSANEDTCNNSFVAITHIFLCVTDLQYRCHFSNMLRTWDNDYCKEFVLIAHKHFLKYICRQKIHWLYKSQYRTEQTREWQKFCLWEDRHWKCWNSFGCYS